MMTLICPSGYRLFGDIVIILLLYFKNPNLQIIARIGIPQQTVEISKPGGTSVAYIRCGWRRIV